MNLEKTLKNLIAIQSTANQPHEILRSLTLIQKILKQNKVDSKIIFLADQPILISGKSNSEILFLGHIDVVPGSKEIFKPRQQNNQIFGRGAFDMKGPIVAMLNAFIKTQHKRSVSLILTSDEELGGHKGIKLILEQNIIQPKFAIVPDGGKNFEIVIEQKGSINLTTQTHGINCHSATPWQGENAINRAFIFVQEIQKVFPNKNKNLTTVCPTVIQSCNNSDSRIKNQIPDQTFINWNIRICTQDSQERIVQIFQEISRRNKTEIVSIEGDGLIFHVNKNNPQVLLWESIVKKTTQKSIRFVKTASTSDARFLTNKQITCLVTQLTGDKAHSNQEWVSFKSIHTFSDCLCKFINMNN